MVRRRSALCSLILCLFPTGVWTQTPQGATAASQDKPSAKLTLDHFLESVHAATQHLSQHELEELSASGAPELPSKARPLAPTAPIDLAAREMFYDCLEAQMLVEIDTSTLQDATMLVARAQQLEGSLTAPHSDVVKAQLTKRQREERLARSTHRQQICQRRLALFLAGDTPILKQLVLPLPSPLPGRDAFLAAIAQANPSLPTNRSPGEFSERLRHEKLLELYDQAAFDAADAERLHSIRDDTRQNQTLIQYRYRGGEASIYDVTSAQEMTIAAEREWTSALLRALRSRDAIARLMGQEE